MVQWNRIVQEDQCMKSSLDTDGIKRSVRGKLASENDNVRAETNVISYARWIAPHHNVGILSLIRKVRTIPPNNTL